VAGPPGPQGAPGPGLDPEWPAIAQVSWPVSGTVSSGEASELLARGIITFSGAAHAETIERQPQVLQIWFEPAGVVVINTVPTLRPVALTALHPSLKIGSDGIRFVVQDEAASLGKLLASGGRLGFRIHCGHLRAADGRPFSASLDPVLKLTKTPRAPGGVHETWVTVVGG
jgi:hypothetical protein